MRSPIRPIRVPSTLRRSRQMPVVCGGHVKDVQCQCRVHLIPTAQTPRSVRAAAAVNRMAVAANSIGSKIPTPTYPRSARPSPSPFAPVAHHPSVAVPTGISALTIVSAAPSHNRSRVRRIRPTVRKVPRQALNRSAHRFRVKEQCEPRIDVRTA